MASLIPPRGEIQTLDPPKNGYQVADQLGETEFNQLQPRDGSLWFYVPDPPGEPEGNQRARSWYPSRGGAYTWFYGAVLVLSPSEAAEFLRTNPIARPAGR